jgi:hypothetical protein
MTKPSEKELKKKVIAHWERMIVWAEKQSKEKRVSKEEMLNAIGERWTSLYCDYCTVYSNICSRCPLDKMLYNCNDSPSPWRDVNNSYTWGEWVENARRFLIILEGV